MLSRRTGKEPLGGSYITPFAQKKINGSTLFIDRALQVTPLALYLDVGFIHAPGVAHRPRVLVPAHLLAGRFTRHHSFHCFGYANSLIQSYE
jgi:hypothetical protein